MKWQLEKKNSRGRRWNALDWRHCRYATCCESEKHGQPAAVGWDNWFSKGKRVVKESWSRMWGRGQTRGYVSSMKRGAGEGKMVRWHTTSPPRANWKPSGSSWLLGRATDRYVGMVTAVQRQPRHGRWEQGVPCCSSWEGGVRHQWQSRMRHRIMRGSSKVDAGSRSRCEEEGTSKLCSANGRPFSGGERGFGEKFVNSDVARPRMARYCEALAWLERGDERIRQEQEHSGLTRKQWKIRLMRERILQMQETSVIEVSGVLQNLVVSSPKELASDLEEGVLVLLSGVMEVVGAQAVGSVTSVLQALDAMPGDDWEEEE